MLPVLLSRQFHLYLHLIYANHKHITHKMWPGEKLAHPTEFLLRFSYTKQSQRKKPSTLQHRPHMLYNMSIYLKPYHFSVDFDRNTL